MNYRISASKKAGFSKFPATTDEFLEYAKAMKRNSTPGGMALGHASGDGNGWVHWCLWAHGGNLVDAKDKVIINSPETEKALNYAKPLYDEMIPGTASWNDAFNNKAFLAGEISLDQQRHLDLRRRQARSQPRRRSPRTWTTPSGRSVRSASRPNSTLMYPVLAMTYTKYPQACKALIAFMLEADNSTRGSSAAQAISPIRLNAYDANPVWTADPKRTVFRDVAKRTLTAGGLGSVGEKAAAAIADFIVLDMFANYLHRPRGRRRARCKIAERQAQRHLSLTRARSTRSAREAAACLHRQTRMSVRSMADVALQQSRSRHRATSPRGSG